MTGRRPILSRAEAVGALARRLGAVLVGALLVATATAPAASAADDPTDGGLWYLSATGADAVHERTTGKGVTVAVIGGPINPTVPDLVGTDLVVVPDAFCDNFDGTPNSASGTTQLAEHASNMVSLIIGTGVGIGGQPGVRGLAPDAAVRFYATLSENKRSCYGGGDDRMGIADAMDQAVADGATIVSISMSGPSPDPVDLAAIGRAERAGVIVVAASNNRGGTALGWPASANGVVSVESGDVSGQLDPTHAVTSPLLAVVAPGAQIRAITWSDGRWDTYGLGSGSSYATAWASAALALVWSAYPDATANQVIQSLLRSTVESGGELARNDSWGYGPVSLSDLLKVDPATYPDVNPLLSEDPAALPSFAEVTGPVTPEPAATPAGEEGAAPAPSTDDGTVSMPLLLGGAGLLLIVIIGAVLVSRRHRTNQAAVPSHTIAPSPAPERHLT